MDVSNKPDKEYKDVMVALDEQLAAF